MASLYVGGRGGLVLAPFTTTAREKKKNSSVHIVTTSYTAEVVSLLPKPQPQLKKKTTPKYHVRLGYNDLAKK